MDTELYQNSKNSQRNILPQKIVPETPKGNPIPVSQPNYFRSEEHLLHFFPNGSRSFFFYDMKSQSNFFQQKVKFIQ